MAGIHFLQIQLDVHLDVHLDVQAIKFHFYDDNGGGVIGGDLQVNTRETICFLLKFNDC